MNKASCISSLDYASKNAKWMQLHVPAAVLKDSKYRKQFAAQKMAIIFNRIVHISKSRRWHRWLRYVILDRKKDKMRRRQRTALGNCVRQKMDTQLVLDMKKLCNLWRTRVSMLQEEEQHAAAVEIQAYARRWLLRNIIQHTIKKNAALLLQTRIRIRRDKLYVEKLRVTTKLKLACLCIQRSYRARRAKRYLSIIGSAHKRRKAAIQIQRMARNCCCKVEWMKRRRLQMIVQESACVLQRFFGSIKARKFMNMARRMQAAETIVLYYRRSLSRRKGTSIVYTAYMQDQAGFIMHSYASIVIQRHYRRYCAMQMLRQARIRTQSAIMVQTLVRMFLAKLHLYFLREQQRIRKIRGLDAKRKIQHAVLSYCYYENYTLVQRANANCLYMLALKQNSLFRDQYARHIQHCAAKAIGRAIRRKLCWIRIHHVHRVMCALHVQRIWRGKMGRQLFKRLVQDKLAWEAKRNASATILQKRFRGTVGRYAVSALRFRLHEEKLYCAANDMQRIFRGRVGRKIYQTRLNIVLAEEHKKLKALTQIQRMSRRVSCKVVALQDVVKLRHERLVKEFIHNRNARIIQRCWHVRQARQAQIVRKAKEKLAKKRKLRQSRRQKLIDQYLKEKNESALEEAELERTIAAQKKLEEEGEWIECFDSASNQPYLYNETTGESKWI